MRFEVLCSVDVNENDVWDYLDCEGVDTDELRESGYEPTDDDYRNAAEWKFNEDDFTYYDFNKV